VRSELLYLGAVDGCKPGMRGVLRAEWLIVAETFEGFADVVRHGEIACACCVIPGECDATVEAAGPVCGGFVEEAKSGEYVFGMFLADVFDSKVVNNEGEGDGSCVVCEDTWRVTGGAVAVLGKMLAKADVGEISGLGEAVHSFANLN
jgi:hypothetical protein